ncbi:hypothetical protein [uncultured Selenomonas sp.]|uniref:hypothetical protein n=1 Tax=uncultured Selenomonas sp. TaxID=159275 RepID=UPI0028EBBE60|nr:hypothetical protein [uncultured Selenomonas sp.]
MARGVSKEKVYAGIKRHWMRLNPGKEAIFSEENPYYLQDMGDNLIEPMYDRVQHSYQAGAGRELDKDMHALHSSAAMTYNLFGNRPAYLFNGEPYDIMCRAYTVTYEKQLTALNPAAKAHLDACLSRRDELLLFEMKMTEWLANSHDPLPASYLSNEKQYPDWDLFVGLKMTRDLFHTEAGEKGYAPLAKHLDTAQLFKHVYAIYNALFYTGELPLTERVKLCLCVWTISKPSFFDDPAQYNLYATAEKELREEFEAFRARLGDLIGMMEDRGVWFDVELLTVRELISRMHKNDQLKRYLC